MGINGTSKPWAVAQEPSSALKRLMAATPEEKRLRWLNFMRGYGLTESQIAPIWEENQRKVDELLAVNARNSIHLATKNGEAL